MDRKNEAREVEKKLAKMRSISKYRSIPMQLFDLALHKIKINTSPGDYYRFKFYLPRKTWVEKSRFVGQHGSMYYPFENNSLRYNVLFTDKYLQKLLYAGSGLPQAELLITIGRGRQIETKEQFADFMHNISFEVVIKPINGTGGSDVFILGYSQNKIIMNTEHTTLEDVWLLIKKNWVRGYVVEKKLSNLPSISDLYPYSLNTYRVITIKTNDGNWHVVAATLKIGCNGNVVDNIAAGGIEIIFDEVGVSKFAFQSGQLITHYPDTGVYLIGLNLAGYQEVQDLALQASKKFSFLGTFGWDIAYTSGGAKIIEGNLFWGTNYPPEMGGLINDEVAKGLNKHRVFSRWDKNYTKVSRFLSESDMFLPGLIRRQE